MKANKVLLATIATVSILTVSITSVSAYGQGNGQGRWVGKNLTQEQREEVQSMNQEERQTYMQSLRDGEAGQGSKWFERGQGWDTKGDMLEGIPLSDLTEEEEQILLYGYSEEMVARDAYNYLYELYGEETFQRIANSEQKHMDAVETLLNRYDLDVPTDYGELQSTFEELKAYGEKWLKEALEVGVQIEVLDIEDIEEAIKNTDNEDFKIVFTKIGGASYNHLRAFLKALEKNDFSTDIETDEFLSESDLETRGSLAYKLAERLEGQGVELPSVVSSEEMKNRKGHGSEGWKWERKGKTQGIDNKDQKSTWGKSWKSNPWNTNAYKYTISQKYGAVINALSDDKLEILVEKIDVLSEKVQNSSSYTADKKQRYNLILGALKEIVLEKLGEGELGLDSLFN